MLTHYLDLFRQFWKMMLAAAFGTGSDKLHLVLRGTPFQTKVWEALLRIPPGGEHTPATETGCTVYIKTGHLTKPVPKPEA